MPRKTRTTPCCGPFSQKQKRLGEVEATIKRLMKNPEGSPRAQANLSKALKERQALVGWIAAHSCSPPNVHHGRAIRI